MFEFFKNLFKIKPDEVTKQSIIINPMDIGSTQYNTWDTQKAINEGMEAHVIVNRCIVEQYSNFQTVKIKVRNIKTKKDNPDHPGMILLNKPYEGLSRSDFQRQVNGFLNLSGDFFSQKIFVYGKLIAMLPLNPKRVTIIPQNNSELLYKYSIGGEDQYIIEEEMFHHKNWNPGNDYYGLAPLKAMGREVDTDNSAASFQKASIDNGGRPSGALSTEGNLNNDQYEKLKKQIKDQIQGKGNARNPLLLEAGLKWVQFSLSPAELDFMSGRKMNALYICIGFRHDPESIGLGSGTYENKNQAEINNWNKATIPDALNYIDALNINIMPEFDDNHEYYIDLSGTPPIVDAENKKLDQGKKYKELGYTTNQINEKLNLGMEDVPWGDIIYMPINQIPVSDVGFQVDQVQEENKTVLKHIKSFNLTTDKQIEAYAKAYNTNRASWWKPIANQIKNTFLVEQKAVIKALKSGKRDMDKTIDAQKPMWEKTITAIWKVLIDDFGSAFADNINNKMFINTLKKYDFDPWSDEVQDFVERYSADNVVDITDTTKKKLRNEIIASTAAKETVEELYKRINTLYDEKFTKYRSMVISRTETIGASNFGTRMSALQSKIMKYKKWITSGSDRVRDTHAAIEGEDRKINELYSIQLMFPGDPLGPANEVIQCMCVEIYFTKEQ